MWEPYKTHLSSMILHDASIIQSKPVNSHDSAATPPQSHDSSNKPHFSSYHTIPACSGVCDDASLPSNNIHSHIEFTVSGMFTHSRWCCLQRCECPCITVLY